MKEENIKCDLEMINVDSPDKAVQYGFQGSPSIKINGRDIEDHNEGFNYSCRIYTINGDKTGIPTKKFFLERIRDVELDSSE